MPPAESLAFWAPKLTDEQRRSHMVQSEKAIAELPAEGYRRDRDIDNVRLYEADPSVTMYNYAGKYYASAGSIPLSPPDDSTNNRAKAAIDTIMSQVASTDQRARFLVNDGDYRQRRRGRKMQNFADGLAHELQLHRHKKRAALDAAVLQSGKGFLIFYPSAGRCACERVLATELSIDPDDGMIDGTPQTIYRRRPMPRDKVVADFAKGKPELEAIIRSQSLKSVTTPGAPSDQVDVWESWHLPSVEGGDDGYHVIGLDIVGGVLKIESYKGARHRLVGFSWEDRFTTVWGLSLMTQARKLQRRINANSYRKDRADKLFHAGHLYTPREMKFEMSSASNEIGTRWIGTGANPPKQILFNAVTQQFIDSIERDGQRIFENLGVNIGASEGATDLGLDASGEALREAKKKTDKRNSVRQQRWEQFGLDCIRAALDVVREIVLKTAGGEDKARAGGYSVAAPGKRGLTVTDWRDVAMDEKDYVLETKAASPIPTDPEGLMAYGEKMVALKVWTPQQFAGYMQDLDADSRANRQLGPERRLEEMFEELLYEKTAAAMPDEFTNYKLALELGLDYLAQGQEDKVPEKHLERVRRYLKRCKKLDAATAAANAPKAPAAGPVAAPAPVQIAA